MTDEEILRRIEQKYHFVPLIIAIIGLVLFHGFDFDFIGVALVLISAGLAIGGMWIRFVMKDKMVE